MTGWDAYTDVEQMLMDRWAERATRAREDIEKMVADIARECDLCDPDMPEDDDHRRASRERRDG